MRGRRRATHRIGLFRYSCAETTPPESEDDTLSRIRLACRLLALAGCSSAGENNTSTPATPAISLGILPDLRYSGRLRSADAWKSVVVDGVLEDEGMASFPLVLDAKSAEAIRAFLIAQAHATAK